MSACSGQEEEEVALGCSSTPGEPASRSLEPAFFVFCVPLFSSLCPPAGRGSCTFQSGSLGPGTRSSPRRVEGYQGIRLRRTDGRGHSQSRVRGLSAGERWDFHVLLAAPARWLLGSQTSNLRVGVVWSTNQRVQGAREDLVHLRFQLRGT